MSITEIIARIFIRSESKDLITISGDGSLAADEDTNKFEAVADETEGKKQ